MIPLLLLALIGNGRPFPDPLLPNYDGTLEGSAWYSATLPLDRKPTQHEIREVVQAKITLGDYDGAIRVGAGSKDRSTQRFLGIARSRREFARIAGRVLGCRPLAAVSLEGNDIVALTGDVDDEGYSKLRVCQVARRNGVWKKTWVSKVLPTIIWNDEGRLAQYESEGIAEFKLFAAQLTGEKQKVVMLHICLGSIHWQPSTAYVFRREGWRLTQIAAVGSNERVVARDLNRDGKMELISSYTIDAVSHAPLWRDVWEFDGKRYRIRNALFPSVMKQNLSEIQAQLKEDSRWLPSLRDYEIRALKNLAIAKRTHR